MQSEQEKYAVIEKFSNEVQPKVFPLLAATDHNVNYFRAILESNWSVDFSVEWLSNAINHFHDKFEWLESSKPALSKKEQRALVGLPEDTWRPDNPDVARKKREAVKAEEKRKYELEPNNIQRVKQECEEMARSASIGSHSDNAEFRRLLSETVAWEMTPVGKRVQWFRTLELRKDLYDKAVNNKSVSTHVRAW
jgi:hypothetical protein